MTGPTNEVEALKKASEPFSAQLAELNKRGEFIQRLLNYWESNPAREPNQGLEKHLIDRLTEVIEQRRALYDLLYGVPLDTDGQIAIQNLTDPTWWCK